MCLYIWFCGYTFNSVNLGEIRIYVLIEAAAVVVLSIFNWFVACN